MRLNSMSGERGSMAAEFAVAAPIFVLLLLLVSAGVQCVSVTGQVGGAARDAARAASMARSPAGAMAQARAAAVQDLPRRCTGGPQVSVAAMSGGKPAPFAAAGDVTVRVSCAVGLAAFRLAGSEARQVFTATALAPLDPFACRSGTC